MGQIDPKWDQSGAFSDQISVHLARGAKCTEIWSEKAPDWSHLGPIWPTFEPNLNPCLVFTLSMNNERRFFRIVLNAADASDNEPVRANTKQFICALSKTSRWLFVQSFFFKWVNNWFVFLIQLISDDFCTFKMFKYYTETKRTKRKMLANIIHSKEFWRYTSIKLCFDATN